MSRKPLYCYLNNTQVDFEKDLLFSHFAKVLKQGQKRMPAGQWPNFIKALTNKGVRKTEIEDSCVLAHLERLDPKKPVTREELIEVIHQNLYTIKEVDLPKPYYENYSQKRDSHHSYQESLYILNSPLSNIEDRLNDIQWELDDLDFEPERLFENPMLAIELHEERTELLQKKKTAYDHRIHHFTSIKDPTTNENLKNVIAHARFTVRDDVFFIEEIQSDWGQQGRATDWERIPKAPYVTHTDTWAGLVFRRLMQRAAAIPNIKQVAWIVGGMENGGRTGSREGVNHFYRNVLPKVADKALSGTKEKTQMKDVKLRDSLEPILLPSIDMTDRVREKFLQSQPLYSKDLLAPQHYRRNLSPDQERSLRREVDHAYEMLGDTVSLQLAKKVIDFATGEEVAGKITSVLKQIQVSLNARDPSFVLNHEVYHYAHETLINPGHAEIVERAFTYPSKLNDRVRAGLVRRNASPEAIQQCDDPKEAAAYAFALWKNGEIELTSFDESESQVIQANRYFNNAFDKKVAQTFRTVEQSFIKLGQWARRVTRLDQKDKDELVVKALFNQLKAGGLAKNKHSLDHQNAIYPHMFQSSQRIRSIQDADNDDHDMTDDSAPPPRRRSIMRG